MNFLPKEIEDIIIDYRNILEISEKWDKVNEEIKIKSNHIIALDKLYQEKYNILNEQKNLRRGQRNRQYFYDMDITSTKLQNISLEHYRLKCLINDKKSMFNFH